MPAALFSLKRINLRATYADISCRSRDKQIINKGTVMVAFREDNLAPGNGE
jgi:hypothetical protein